MKQRIICKTLAVAVIILFLGLAIQPSVATVQPESIDTEYFDVTTEFIGLGKEQTVQLTKQQLDELDALFESIREQLNNTESKEEIIQIYNNAIKRLDSIGLLDDLSSKQAQKLATGIYQNQKIKNLIAERNHRTLGNRYCFTVGNTNYHYFISLGSQLINYELYSIIASFYQWIDDNFYLILPSITKLILLPFALIMELMDFASFLFSNFIRPLSIGNIICFGAYLQSGYGGTIWEPSRGWVYTNGVDGVKKWDGALWGNLPMEPYFIKLYLWDTYPGISGFTGIKIGNFFMGYAQRVEIVYD